MISHVTDPLAVLDQMSRVVKPGGVLVIFDGDYASLTYAYPDRVFGDRIDDALARVTFNNPSIMRELPRRFAAHGLQISEAWGEVVAEIGSGSTPRNGAGLIATDAAASPRPARIIVSRPPKEWPMITGFPSKVTGASQRRR